METRKFQVQGRWDVRLLLSLVKLSFLFAITFGVGAQAEARENLNVYADPTIRVSLATDPAVTSDSSTQHSHPIDLDTTELLSFLAGLEIEQDLSFIKSIVKDVERTPLFTSQEQQTLRPHLQKALGLALPQEFVTFTLFGLDGSGKKTITSGALHVKGQEISIVINRYKSPTKKPDSFLPTPYQSSLARKPPGKHTRLPNYQVFFAPKDAVVQSVPSATDQLFGSPETAITIDRQRLVQIAKSAAPEVGQESKSIVTQGSSISRDSSQQVTALRATIQRLQERIKSQDDQIADLLEIVKQLTSGQSSKSSSASPRR